MAARNASPQAKSASNRAMKGAAPADDPRTCSAREAAETLGISMYEGALVGAWPMVPRRLSYGEMWQECYPTAWTKDWNSYQENKC